MVESTAYTPSEDNKALIFKHLNDGAIIDAGYKKTVTLKQTEAKRRAELISNVEYDFQLALNTGDYYLGGAVINFYLNTEPKDGELVLNFNAIAVNDLCINDKPLRAQQGQSGSEFFQD